jgi:TolA-binding protein
MFPNSSRIASILLVLAIMLARTPEACAHLLIESDQQYAYAQQLLKEQQFRRAAEEFQRFAFLFAEDPRQRTALLRAGEAFLMAGEFDLAVKQLAKVISQPALDENAISAYFILAETLLQRGSPEQAIQQLRILVNRSGSSQIRDRAFFRIGWIHLQNLNWTEAQRAFAQISLTGHDQFGVEKIRYALGRIDQIPQKSPVLAGTLSIIPGTGQLYIHRYQDALAAFLVNIGLIWAAVDAFEDEQYALGGLLSVAGAGFYTANIYGAITGAHKYNRSQKLIFVDQLKEQVKEQVTIGFGPFPHSGGSGSGSGVLLSVRVIF